MRKFLFLFNFLLAFILLTSQVWAFSDGNVLERGQFGFGLTSGYKRFTASGPGGSLNVDFYRLYPDAGFGYKSFIGPTELRLGLGYSSYNVSGTLNGSPVTLNKSGLAVALSSANKVIRERAGLPSVSIEGILDFSFFSGESIYFYGLAVIVNKHFDHWNLFAEPGLFMFSFGDNSKFDARLGGGLSYEISKLMTAKAAVDYDLGDFSGLQFKFGISYNLPVPEVVEEEGAEPTGYYSAGTETAEKTEAATAGQAAPGDFAFSVEPKAALPGETLMLRVKAPKDIEVINASVELGPGKGVELKKSTGAVWTANYQLPLDVPRGNYAAVFHVKTAGNKTLDKKVSYKVE